MVCEPSLAMCARDIGLGSYLYLGKERNPQEDDTGFCYIRCAGSTDRRCVSGWWFY